MFRILIVIVLTLLWSVSGASNSVPAPKMLVFGDSLSAAYGIPEREAWVALLGDRLEGRNHPWRVRNLSISGETTAGGRSRIDAALADHTVDIVVLALGGNDGLRGLGLPSMRENLEYMIDAAEDAGARVLLVGIQIPPNYGPVYSRRFAEVFSSIAAARDLDFLPFLLEGVALEPGMMLDDGIHPSVAAQPRILENVWEYLLPLLESIERDRTVSLPIHGTGRVIQPPGPQAAVPQQSGEVHPLRVY
jgi:acyl-CoA thioesterase-1